jgi:hypothetical protein
LVGAFLIGSLKADPTKADSMKLIVNQNTLEEIVLSLLQLLSYPLIQIDLVGDGLELCDQILLLLNVLTTEGGSIISLNTTTNTATRYTHYLQIEYDLIFRISV